MKKIIVSLTELLQGSEEGFFSTFTELLGPTSQRLSNRIWLMTLPYEVCVGKRKVFYPPASPKMLISSDFHELALKPSIAC